MILPWCPIMISLWRQFLVRRVLWRTSNQATITGLTCQRAKAYEQVMSCLMDVIYHLGKFYVVDAYSGIHSVDISSFSEPRSSRRVGSSYHHKSWQARHVLSNHVREGDLLLVQRFLASRGNPRQPTTSCFKIFKVLGSSAGIDGQIVERVEIYSLGDNTLFLGDNYIFSICVFSRFSRVPAKLHILHWWLHQVQSTLLSLWISRHRYLLLTG